MTPPTIAILGAGPVGLDAALAAVEAGFDFTVYEAGARVADHMRTWGHVRLFTPWSMNVSPRMRAALGAAGQGVGNGSANPAGPGERPQFDTGDCPRGIDVVEGVLEPVARLPQIAPHLRLEHRVVEIGREGMLKHEEIGTGGRADRPFRLLVRGPDGREHLDHADVVIDCSGTYGHPNALGAGGIRAPGESVVEASIVRRIPDFTAEADGNTSSDTLPDSSSGWEGLRILLVGAGHSAQTAARDLAEVVARAPSTSVTWVIRSASPAFAAIENDPLPSRSALVRRAGALALGQDSPFDVRLGRTVDALHSSPDGVVVTLKGDDGQTEEVVDRIVSLTGSVGDASLYRQLQVHECYATSGPMKLAGALLGSSSADCLDQASHGAETLKNPEPDFYILGSKSYGRNTTFLLRVGWEQVDDVFSLLGASSALAGAVQPTS